MPGWKQEMTYSDQGVHKTFENFKFHTFGQPVSDKALVGNWYERRLKKPLGKLDFLTTQREQYKAGFEEKIVIFTISNSLFEKLEKL